MSKKSPLIRKKGRPLSDKSIFVVPIHRYNVTHDYNYKTFVRYVESLGAKVAKNAGDADALLFTGGVDISPSLYGQTAHWQTQTADVERDRREIGYFLANPDKLKVGICRGAQLLNVLSGGRLIQHLSRNTHRRGAHSVIDPRTKLVVEGVASTHHQMMLPSKKTDSRELLLFAFKGDNKPSHNMTLVDDWREKELSPEITKVEKNQHKFLMSHRARDFSPLRQDLEAVYYHGTKSLCIQGHPEAHRSSVAFADWCHNEIYNRLNSV